tara:strand:+ start:737 stop:1078 length:342 start_codon:yes stop_codon:yes gene_type:complete
MAIKKETYFIECGDRYRFDFDLCRPSQGYSQVDTKQDASYYGHWANPFDFKLVGFVEGDVTVSIAPNKEEFVDLMRSTAKWYADNDDKLNIDPMLDDKQEQAWKDLGLADLLH